MTRQYVVEPGDSPAKIAIKFAGCPKCGSALAKNNPQKATVTYPNGFVTFKELRVGEVLNLPDSWFNGEHDALPPEYFKSLPYADGVTLGVGMACRPRPRMKTVADANDGSPNDWDDGT